MIDAWMNLWTKGPETKVTGWSAMNDALPSVTDGDMPMWLTSLSTPVMAPAMVGAVAANTVAATWVGMCMSVPLASAEMFKAFAGSGTPKTQTAKPARKPAARVVAAVQTAAKKTVKTEASAAKKTTAAVALRAKRAAPKAMPKTGVPKLDDRPAGLDAPKGNKADDLKRISGVGPKLESVLNDLGIYHFDQVAAWTKKEIAWVDDYLRFKGRIDRDGWIAQAKTLAKEVA